MLGAVSERERERERERGIGIVIESPLAANETLIFTSRDPSSANVEERKHLFCVNLQSCGVNMTALREIQSSYEQRYAINN